MAGIRIVLKDVIGKYVATLCLTINESECPAIVPKLVQWGDKFYILVNDSVYRESEVFVIPEYYGTAR